MQAKNLRKHGWPQITKLPALTATAHHREQKPRNTVSRHENRLRSKTSDLGFNIKIHP